MSLSLLSIALLSTAALAVPHPEVEVVEVRHLVKRQDPTPVDLNDFLPTGVDLSDLESLYPTAPIDISSLLGDISTLVPSDVLPCLPPSDLPRIPVIPLDVGEAVATYTGLCAEPTCTGTVGQHYSSYISEASKYAEDNGAVLSSWLEGYSTNCPYATAIPTASELLGGYSLPSCGNATKTGATTAKPTNPSATTGGAPEEATGAASQRNAFAAVAGVVAGFAGLVAVL